MDCFVYSMNRFVDIVDIGCGRLPSEIVRHF
jgi:hypothetical protein